MFSHVMLGVNDIAAAKRFYDAIFASLGLGPGVDKSIVRTSWVFRPI
jgi:catechol 2,3-dioxygenase-like lactoylglutathione lyase family enzyme